MTDCEIDNNDTKLMQLSNDLNSYCVNESINRHFKQSDSDY